MNTTNRNLFFGLAFVIGAAIVWTMAAETHREKIGAVRSGEVTLEQVAQYRALFPDRSLQEWLGHEQAETAEKQRTRYGWAFTGAVACGFLALVFLGVHLDGLRSDQESPKLGGTAKGL